MPSERWECIGGEIDLQRVLLTMSRAWLLATKDVTEPPRRLANECKKIGIEDGAFLTCGIGETVTVPYDVGMRCNVFLA